MKSNIFLITIDSLRVDRISSMTKSSFTPNIDKLIKNTSKIIISPGISKSNENIKFAISKKIDVISEIEFASSYIEKPLIAITGTNGKTTTCLLTYALLKDLGKKVFLGGNIGKPLISSLNRKIEYDLYLVECSSFQ